MTWYHLYTKICIPLKLSKSFFLEPEHNNVEAHRRDETWADPRSNNDRYESLLRNPI